MHTYVREKGGGLGTLHSVLVTGMFLQFSVNLTTNASCTLILASLALLNVPSVELHNS